jgi:hypothetical protein
MRSAIPLLCALAAVAPVVGVAQDEDGEDLDLDAADIFSTELTEEQFQQRVLVVPLTGTTAESQGVGALLEGYLADHLDPNRYEAMLLDEAPPVDDVAASLYYEGCPAGDELGCQFVLAEVSGVDRVIGGRVTVSGEGRYRVVVTVLGVRSATLEFTYALDLAAGEESLLPRTVELALERLRREELLEPLRDEEARRNRRRSAVEQARTTEDRLLVGRMSLDVSDEVFRGAEVEKKERGPRISEEDIEAVKEVEGLRGEWEEIGISEKQYLSWKNSNLDLDAWRWRWAGHRLMLLGSFHVGFAAGASGVRYYGAYLLSDDLRTVVDSYGWQRTDGGATLVLGGSIGIGILRNLDFEAGFSWQRARATVKLGYGSAIETADGWVADPANRPPSDWSTQTLDTIAGDIMLRYSILVVPIIRPTVGLGAYWIVYPNLYNDPNVADDVEQPEPAIPQRFPTFPRITDVGPQLEVGVALDFNRHVGLFLRAPMAFLLSPARQRTSGDYPPAVIVGAEDPGKPPIGVFRLLLGVQGRLFGLPVRLKERDTMMEIEE